MGSVMKILAVVVTHNRCVLLSRAIDYLQAQMRRPDHILVINNGSEDDTEKMLATRSIDVINQENVGSAGGWHRGIDYALNNGFDAVWLMDDDGFPDVDALAVLETSLSYGVACASSVVIREDDHNRFVFPFPVLDKYGLPVLIQHPRKLVSISELEPLATDGTYPFAHFFNGALISVTSIRKVGNVELGFFIFGDEVDYFFRLRAVGKVISVLSARHFHPDVSSRPYTSAKVYYYIKNTIVLNRRYFNAVWLRHALTLLAVLVRTARRNGLGMALSLLAGRQAPVFYGAILRGLAGHIGKDFRG
jgi:rhamnopyranosyl-N-acetylglucosaminyl-diphospho-decaprenol beta-1,3/1,4-galactofuranosyltransferase